MTTVSEVVEENVTPCVNKAVLFGHKLIHLKFEIHVVMHLSQQRLHTAIKIYTFLFQMRSWLLKGMGDGTLIDLLDLLLCPNNAQIPILDLRQAQKSFIRHYNSNSARDPPTKYLRFRQLR